LFRRPPPRGTATPCPRPSDRPDDARGALGRDPPEEARGALGCAERCGDALPVRRWGVALGAARGTERAIVPAASRRVTGARWGAVRCGVVRCGVVRCGVVRCGVARSGFVGVG
jgi:hypothetical protein